jgi:U6 snRNA-associated Sm-like protein LSm5
MKSEKEI